MLLLRNTSLYCNLDLVKGQPPRYSNQQQKILKLFIKHNNDILEQENLPTPPLPNSASWLFNPPTQPTTHPSSTRIMY